jgi:hypothetical protein
MWRDFTKALQDMRGPGPKWHAKYDNLVNHNSPPTAPSGPVLREVAEQHA